MSKKIYVDLNWEDLDDLLMCVINFLNTTEPNKGNGMEADADMYHEERINLKKLHKQLLKAITTLIKAEAKEIKKARK